MRDSGYDDRVGDRAFDPVDIDPRGGARARPAARRREPGTYLGPVRLTPTRVVLAVALVGSLAYLAFAISVRDASSIPMLSSGAAVLGIVFAALAITGAVSVYRAASEGRTRAAFTAAILGGGAAILAAGCFAAAVVLALVLQGGPLAT